MFFGVFGVFWFLLLLLVFLIVLSSRLVAYAVSFYIILFVMLVMQYIPSVFFIIVSKTNGVLIWVGREIS